MASLKLTVRARPRWRYHAACVAFGASSYFAQWGWHRASMRVFDAGQWLVDGLDWEIVRTQQCGGR
jgi:hypothetical protein